MLGSMTNEGRFEPRRELGRTGFRATAIGLGDVADRRIPPGTLADLLRRGLDAGVNVVDTAPGYEDGYSEEIVGAALRGRRDGVFLIDKIDQLDRPVAGQVEVSLRRLGVEAVDAFVFHGVPDVEAWARITAPGGLMDELEACVRAGKARFRGVSSHDPDVVRAAILGGGCGVVMFAAGPYVESRYVDELLPLARQRGVGTVCFKTFGAGKLLGDTSGYNQPLRERPRGKVSSGGGEAGAVLPRLGVEECVHYTLTLDPDVALLGLSFENEREAAFAAVRAFRPLPAGRMAEIRERAAEAIRGKGPCWWNPGAR